MLEYACQRIYRDARITSIYEGTTQLQTVAAIRYVTNGSYAATLRDYETIPCSEEMQPLMDRLKEMKISLRLPPMQRKKLQIKSCWTS